MIETNTGATSASAATVYTDFNGLARLRHAAQAQDTSPETVRKVAQQFEALFLQMMLKNMRNTGVEDKLFGSDQEQMYRDMFDQQLSVDLSEKGALGLADLLVRQLTHQPTTAASSMSPRSLPAAAAGAASASPPTAAGVVTAPSATVTESQESAATSPQAAVEEAVTATGTPVRAEPEAEAEAEIRTPEDFIRVLGPHAEAAARELGVPPRVLLAQAALESGWGGNVMRTADGGSSHNLFGIKADARWDGRRVVAETLEYEGGIAVKRREVFRAYDSYADSFDDYVGFLRSNPRYSAALEAGTDGDAFLRRLQQAGYATDPDYADKIGRIAYGGASRLAEWPAGGGDTTSLTLAQAERQ